MSGRGVRILVVAAALAAGVGAIVAANRPAVGEARRPRAREVGVKVGVLPPGPLDAITDVAGVRVGHLTLIEGDDVRTGVSAVLPHGGDLFREKVPAGIAVANGFGKLAGFTQVEELGSVETPVVLTNTLSVGAAIEGTVAWTLTRPGNAAVRSVNAVVAETNDGRLNDIGRMAVRPDHVRRAIEAARAGPVEEGCVGAGTGTIALGFKGGIGTASRRLPDRLGGYTVGVLAQTNFGGILTVAGVPVGLEVAPLPFGLEAPGGDAAGPRAAGTARAGSSAGSASADGSCVLVVATDAPCGSRNLKRLARRALAGIWRTGGAGSSGSGDYAIAFSTAPSVRIAHVESIPEPPALIKFQELPDDAMSPLFMAAAEAAEEAILNSLLAATTMTGRGGLRVEALPIEQLKEILARAVGRR